MNIEDIESSTKGKKRISLVKASAALPDFCRSINDAVFAMGGKTVDIQKKLTEFGEHSLIAYATVAGWQELTKDFIDQIKKDYHKFLEDHLGVIAYSLAVVDSYHETWLPAEGYETFQFPYMGYTSDQFFYDYFTCVVTQFRQWQTTVLSAIADPGIPILSFKGQATAAVREHLMTVQTELLELNRTFYNIGLSLKSFKVFSDIVDYELEKMKNDHIPTTPSLGETS